MKKQHGQTPSALLKACLNLKMEMYLNKDANTTNSKQLTTCQSIADERAAAFTVNN